MLSLFLNNKDVSGLVGPADPRCVLSSGAQAELDSVESELELVELQIAELLQKQAELTSRKNALLQSLGEACDAAQSSSSSSSKSKPEPVMSKKEMKRYDGTGGVITSLHC